MRLAIVTVTLLAAGPAAAESVAALAVDLPAAKACLLRPADLDHDLPATVQLASAGKTLPLTVITRDVGRVKLGGPVAPAAGAKPDPRDYRSWPVAVTSDTAVPWGLAPLHGKPARPTKVEDLPVTTPEAVEAVAVWLKAHEPDAKPALRRVARWDQPGLGTVTLAWSWSMPTAGAPFDPAVRHSLLLALVQQNGRSSAVELAHGATIADMRVEAGLAAIGDSDGSGTPAVLIWQAGERTVYSAMRLDAGPAATLLGFCAIAGKSEGR